MRPEEVPDVLAAHEAIVRAKVAAEGKARYEALAAGYREIAYDGGMPGATRTGGGSPRNLRAEARFLDHISADLGWITGDDQ